MSTVQLSDTQRQILTSAWHRRGRRALPLTVDLKGGAVQVVLKSLLAKGLVEEVLAKGKQPAWRTTDAGVPLALRATRAAYDALGIGKTKSRPKADGTGPKAPRTDTKQALLISMLQRGAIAGALKKRLGLTITSAKEEGRGRVYRVHC